MSLSILDLCSVCEGASVGDALRASLSLAEHAERWGARRFWVAEHHNLGGVASAATAVLIGQLAAHTRTLRVGAGGIMLPNHAPLVVAEQFGTLAELYPGRIELGLGRAPGSDAITQRALRRGFDAADRFPEDVQELMALLEPAAPGQAVRAVPGAGTRVPLFILGSSLFGAQLAAQLGLPYAFAAHFAPDQLLSAVALYKARFVPSERCPRPYVMAGINVVAAATQAEARLLFTSVQQAVLRLRRGQPGPLPAPVAGLDDTLRPDERALLEHVLRYAVVGSEPEVRDELAAFKARAGVDELVVTAQIHDVDARLASFERVARCLAA
jgi:luciferase family oxidoreductase group 1